MTDTTPQSAGRSASPHDYITEAAQMSGCAWSCFAKHRADGDGGGYHSCCSSCQRIADALAAAANEGPRTQPSENHKSAGETPAAPPDPWKGIWDACDKLSDEPDVLEFQRLLQAALAIERQHHAAQLDKAIDDEQCRIATRVFEGCKDIIECSDSDGFEEEDPAEHLIRWIQGLNGRHHRATEESLTAARAEIVSKDEEIKLLRRMESRERLAAENARAEIASQWRPNAEAVGLAYREMLHTLIDAGVSILIPSDSLPPHWQVAVDVLKVINELRAEIARLTEVVARWQSAQVQCLNDAREEHDRAEAAEASLLALQQQMQALKWFVRHWDTCDFVRTHCTCGLAAHLTGGPT